MLDPHWISTGLALGIRLVFVNQNGFIVSSGQRRNGQCEWGKETVLELPAPGSLYNGVSQDDNWATALTRGAAAWSLSQVGESPSDMCSLADRFKYTAMFLRVSRIVPILICKIIHFEIDFINVQHLPMVEDADDVIRL